MCLTLYNNIIVLTKVGVNGDYDNVSYNDDGSGDNGDHDDNDGYVMMVVMMMVMVMIMMDM